MVTLTRRNRLPSAGISVESVTLTVRRPEPRSETVLSEPLGTAFAPPVLVAMSVHEPAARVGEDWTV